MRNRVSREGKDESPHQENQLRKGVVEFARAAGVRGGTAKIISGSGRQKTCEHQKRWGGRWGVGSAPFHQQEAFGAENRRKTGERQIWRKQAVEERSVGKPHGDLAQGGAQ